jgi:hypothetical protein
MSGWPADVRPGAQGEGRTPFLFDQMGPDISHWSVSFCSRDGGLCPVVRFRPAGGVRLVVVRPVVCEGVRTHPPASSSGICVEVRERASVHTGRPFCVWVLVKVD